MVVCVIGCTGYLGSKISSRLYSQGYKVIGVCRKFPKENKKFKGKFFKIIEGDIANKKFQNRIFKNFFSSIVYTISLNHKISEQNLSDSININYIPLLNICNIISQNNLKIKLIYFSTMQVYGNYNQEKIITEQTKKKCKNIYALTHSMCEDILSIYSSLSNINSISLRLSNGYGFPELKTCDCWWLVINDFCLNAANKNEIKINSDGSPLRDFLHISDIAIAVEKLLNYKKKLPKIMNLCSGKTVSMLEIAAIVKKKSSKINQNPNLYVKGHKLNEKNLFKKIKILNKKQKFKINNKEMKKLQIIPKISLSEGIEKTLVDLKERNN